MQSLTVANIRHGIEGSWRRVYPCRAAVIGLILLITPWLPAMADVQGNLAEPDYAQLAIHIGFENAASPQRINFPLHILLSGENWREYNEQFRQLGLLIDLWDQARQGVISLEESRNVPLPGSQASRYERQLRIVRTDWQSVGKRCGYRANGQPHSGCAFNKRLPKCTIVVPHQYLYADGDINEYHQLLGHELWHCVVGSFH